MKVILWIDDVRDPEQFCLDRFNTDTRIIWCKSVHEAIHAYTLWGSDLNDSDIQLVKISLDHDAGDYAKDGGDYIKFLDWMERNHAQDIPKLIWAIHSMNPVGYQNMARILRKYGVMI